MSMSTNIVGFKPPDEKWKAMKEVWEVCKKIDISTPQEGDDFFEDEDPNDSGVKIELEGHPCVSDFSDEFRDGFEVDIKKLPKDVTVIRFYNSW